MHGPFPGRRHDIFLLNESNIVADLRQLFAQHNVPPLELPVLYGDPAYPLLDVLQTGFKGTNLDQARRKYNTLMSKVRECVEWQFGEVVREWAFLDFAGARAASSWCGRACSARRRPAEQPQRGDAPGRRRRRRGYEPLGRRRHLDDVVALPPPGRRARAACHAPVREFARKGAFARLRCVRNSNSHAGIEFS